MVGKHQNQVEPRQDTMQWNRVTRQQNGKGLKISDFYILFLSLFTVQLKMLHSSDIAARSILCITNTYYKNQFQSILHQYKVII